MKIIPVIVMFILTWDSTHSNHNNTGCPQMEPPPTTYSNTEESRVLHGGRQFALTLLATVLEDNKDTSKNIFLSPSSIWQALLSTYFGAQGTTAERIAQILGLTEQTKSQVSSELRHLNSLFFGTANATAPEENVLLSTNCIFLQKGNPLCSGLSSYLGGKLGGKGIQQLDFINEPNAARGAINSWVESQTNNKIKDLIQEGDVNQDTRLVLVNAAYFSGTWAKQFDKKLTSPHKFFIKEQKANDGGMTVPMMSIRTHFRYVRSETYQAEIVELPFVNEKLSLFAALPLTPASDVDRVVELMLTLNASKLSEELAGMENKTVELLFPRLTINEPLELTSVLTKIGLGLLFSGSEADLTGFTGQEGLFVGAVRHKAFLEVNEMGAEAAAATGMVFLEKSFDSMDGNSIFLEFNRPFVLFLRDNELKFIHFAGIVRDPSS